MTSEDMCQTQHVSTLACEAMILQNDFYSWEVEYEEYVQHGDSSQFVNGVFVLMGLYSTDVEEVKV